MPLITFGYIDFVVDLFTSHSPSAPVNFTDGVHIMGDIITSQSIDSISVSSLANNILTIVKNQTLEGKNANLWFYTEEKNYILVRQ